MEKEKKKTILQGEEKKVCTRFKDFVLGCVNSYLRKKKKKKVATLSTLPHVSLSLLWFEKWE